MLADIDSERALLAIDRLMNIYMAEVLLLLLTASRGP